MHRPLALALCLAALAVAPRARAQAYPMHVAYGLGGGAHVGDLDGGLRQNLDVGVGYGTFDTRGSRDGMWSSHKGLVVEGAGAIGFGHYPSYVTLEAGPAEDTTLAGGVGTLGLAARVDPSAGLGVGARLAADLLFLQLGVRGVVIFVGEPDYQVTALIGLGRF